MYIISVGLNPFNTSRLNHKMKIAKLQVITLIRPIVYTSLYVCGVQRVSKMYLLRENTCDKMF